MNTSIRQTLRFALVVAVLGVVALVAGCGGGGGGGSAQDILKKTFGANKAVHSGRLTLDLGLNLQGVKSLNGPVSFKLDGPFQSTGAKGIPKFEFTLGVSASGQSFTAGATSTGDKAYLSFLGNNYAVSDQQFATFKQGYEQAQANSAKQSRSTFSALGVAPLKWLTSPQTVGTESAGGTSTTHIRAGVDIPRLLDDVDHLLTKAGSLGVSGVRSVPRTITPQQRASIQRAVKSATVDVYAGKDDQILRRLTVNVTLTSGTISFDLTIANLNQAQTVTAPANAQPLSALLNSLGARSGGGSGGATGGLLGHGRPPGGTSSAAAAGLLPSTGGSSGSSGSASSGQPRARRPRGRPTWPCLQKAGPESGGGCRGGVLVSASSSARGTSAKTRFRRTPVR